DNIGALLRGVKREEIERGQVLAKPGSITPHTHYEAQIYVLTKEEGGRHTPFFNGYRPQFYFRTTDVTGVMTLPEGTEMVMPGDNVKVTVKLITPIAMDEGLRFAIREAGRTVGAGVVGKIREWSWPREEAHRRSGAGALCASASTARGRNSRERQDENQAEGVRLSAPGPVGAGDRRGRAPDGRSARRPDPAADAHRAVHREPLAARRQEVARALRDPHAQAVARHPRSDPADHRRARQARSVGRRRCRDQTSVGPGRNDVPFSHEGARRWQPLRQRPSRRARSWACSAGRSA